MCSAGLSGFGHALDGLPDPGGGVVGVGLAGVESGDDSFESECGDQPGRPVLPGTVRKRVGEVGTCNERQEALVAEIVTRTRPEAVTDLAAMAI